MANEYIGRKITAGISLEETRGTPKASPDFWLRILAQNHKDKADYLHSQGSIGTIVEHAHAEIDKQWGEGGFDAEIDADSIGLILLSTTGDIDTLEVAAGEVYLHTFELEEDANHQSISYWVNEPGRSVVYPLSCMNTLSFSFERGKILDFSANFMSQTGENEASTPSFEPLKAFRPKDFHFYLADDIDGLASANEVFLKTLSLEFNKNLEPDDVLGLESPKNFLNKVFSLSASLSLLYQDGTYRDFFKAGTSKAMRIKLLNPNLILKNAIAATGTATIVDYSALSGATVTVGSTVLTEGVEWTAATSNEATATSLAAAIHALANVNAAAVGAVVTVTAATAGIAGNSIGLATNGGSDLTLGGLSGGNLSGGADAVHPYLVFDFARVYFSEYDEENGRDDLKAQSITMSFAVNTEEVNIQFMQIRLQNGVTTYLPTP